MARPFVVFFVFFSILLRNVRGNFFLNSNRERIVRSKLEFLIIDRLSDR